MLNAAFGKAKPVGGPFACPVCPGPIPPFPGFNKAIGTFGAIPPIPGFNKAIGTYGAIPPFPGFGPMGPIPGFGPIPPYNANFGTYPGICTGCV